nr:hypothetical protein GCM10020093_075520 [Planobispora longispora]
MGMSKDVPYTMDGKRKVKVNKYGLPKDGKAKVIWKEEEMPAFIGGGGTPTQIWHDYMALATAKDEVVQFPTKAGVGIPKNLATPKPTPTPTVPDPDDTENPSFEWPDDNGGGDGGVGQEPEGRDCLPWDGSCDAQGQQGNGNGNGQGNDDGFGTSPGAAVMPTPTPSGRRP